MSAEGVAAPGSSIAEVARKHQLNAHLVHTCLGAFLYQCALEFRQLEKDRHILVLAIRPLGVL